MNFCSAKKQTLQSFVVKKADTANICSQKKRTLQSLGGDTIQLCTGHVQKGITDTKKLYTVWTIQIWARA